MQTNAGVITMQIYIISCNFSFFVFTIAFLYTMLINLTCFTPECCPTTSLVRWERWDASQLPLKMLPESPPSFSTLDMILEKAKSSITDSSKFVLSCSWLLILVILVFVRMICNLQMVHHSKAIEQAVGQIS